MLLYRVTEINRIVGGKLFRGYNFADTGINRIITDSRTLFNPENSIFFALTGPRNNGHNYINELIINNLPFFVVSQPESIHKKATFILVNDTTEALQKLAAFHRKKFQFPVIGITGSNGKTIVKEWLFKILSEKYSVIRSPKSYNSQVGVPVSILLLNENFNLGIFEAGISQPGEMQRLESMLIPDMGIFTNIGDAHQENFKTIKQKIQEKLLLFRQSKKIIYCSDHLPIREVLEPFCTTHSIKKTSWSVKDKNARVFFSVKKEKRKTNLTAWFRNKKYSFSIPFTDDSSVENACHCFVTALELIKQPEQFQALFGNLEPVEMRLEIKQGINNCLLINDFYNADLNSLKIALSVLHQQATQKHFKKTIILSDIEQTGIPSKELYRQVNDLLTEWKTDKLTGIGPEISKHGSQFTLEKKLFASPEDFIVSFARSEYESEAILLKGARFFTFEKIASLLQQKSHQTVLEIHMDSFINNLNVFKSLLKPETKIMVMVKAFSYGSGDVEIARLLQYQQVDYLAVAVADEGVQLRNAGIRLPIVVMNPEVHSFGNIIDYQLEPNIYCYELLKQFMISVKNSARQNYPVHIKIDTGMNRLGFKTDEEIKNAVEKISSNKLLKIESVFSHLAGSDDPLFDDFTLKQIKEFQRIADFFEREFRYKIDRHILNSAGIERFKEYQFEMVRLGIGLYGISCTDLNLESIGTFKSVVSQVKAVEPGETIGYSRKGSISKPAEIAVVPVGYADGLDRKLGNGVGWAFVKNKRVPITGNICMDMLMLDVTGLGIKTGDEVEFFGKNISITEVADWAGTIPYEILTGISQRVKRVYLQE